MMLENHGMTGSCLLCLSANETAILLGTPQYNKIIIRLHIVKQLIKHIIHNMKRQLFEGLDLGEAKDLLFLEDLRQKP